MSGSDVVCNIERDTLVCPVPGKLATLNGMYTLRVSMLRCNQRNYQRHRMTSLSKSLPGDLCNNLDVAATVTSNHEERELMRLLAL